MVEIPIDKRLACRCMQRVTDGVCKMQDTRCAQLRPSQKINIEHCKQESDLGTAVPQVKTRPAPCDRTPSVSLSGW